MIKQMSWTKPLGIWMILVSLSVADAATFDPFSDWSTTSNPNGAWSYGFTSSLGATFNLFPNSTTAALNFPSSLQGWQDFRQDVALGVYRNASGGTINNSPGTAVIGPGLLFLHPGPIGQYADLRFTASSAGVFSIVGEFVGVEHFPATSDAHVLVNGVSVFDTTMGLFGARVGFNLTRSLALGGTMDAVVGFGSNGNHVGDGTGLTLTISLVPEPDSLLFVGGAALLALGHAWWFGWKGSKLRQTVNRC